MRRTSQVEPYEFTAEQDTSPRDPKKNVTVRSNILTVIVAGGPGIALVPSVPTQEAVPHSSQFYRDEWAGQI